MSWGDLPEHILNRVAQQPDGCWLWTGGCDDAGYGHAVFQGKNWRTHKLFWIAENGPVPDGLELSHDCHVKACCNPGHVIAETHQDNMRRGIRRHVICANGLHEMTEANSNWFMGVSSGKPLKKRRCLACRRAAWTRANKKRDPVVYNQYRRERYAEMKGGALSKSL